MLGRHFNINKNLLNTIKIANEKFKVNCIQVFLKAPARYSFCKIKNFDEINKYVTDNKLKLCSHSTYLCNLAKKGTDNKYFKMVIDDINCMYKLGGFGTVVHVGKSCKNDKKECFNNMIENVKYILDSTENGTFILETAAGQGTEMLVKIEEMAEFYNSFEEKYKNRIKFCIDTCHIFAAGYNLNSIEEINLYFDTFDSLIGLNNVSVIHFNDSKCDCGTRKDRHESIGCGKIKLESLKYIYNKLNDLGIPIVLETKGTISVEEEFKLVRSFKN